MERRMRFQVLLILGAAGLAVNARTLAVTSAAAIPLISVPPLPTSTSTAEGRVPVQPASFTACWGTIIPNTITWDVQTTTFTNITVVPHVTPYPNGTNITSYETIAPQGPAPTAILSTTMFNGSVCVAPTPCVEQLSQGCDQAAERRLFRRLDSTGSAGSTPFTNPSTYITATSIFNTAYTAPPKIEPRKDATSAAGGQSNSDPDAKPSTREPAPTPEPTREPVSALPQITPDASSDSGDNENPQPVPSQTGVQGESSPRPLPPLVSSLLGGIGVTVRPSPAAPTAGEVNASGNPSPVVNPSPVNNPRPGSETANQGTTPATPASSTPTNLPPGFSVLPSQSGVVLPGGQTLQPGSATTVSEVVVSIPPSTLPNGQTQAPGSVTTISEVVVSLAPSGSFIAIGGTSTIDLPPSPTPVIPNLPSGFSPAPSGSGLVLPNGQTLAPGSATIISGIPVSLSPSESVLVVEGSKTIPLAPGSTPMDEVVLPNGETLKPGVQTTILGVPVSLSPGETRVVIDGSTISLAPTATGELASYIWSGISAEATALGVTRSASGSATRASSGSASTGAETTSSAASSETGSSSASPLASPSDSGAAAMLGGHAAAFAVVVGVVQVWFWS